MVYNTMHMIQFILVFKRAEQNEGKTKKDRRKEKMSSKKQKEHTKTKSRTKTLFRLNLVNCYHIKVGNSQTQ